MNSSKFSKHLDIKTSVYLLFILWSTQVPDRPRLWCRRPGTALQPPFPRWHWRSCSRLQLKDCRLLGRRETGNTQPPTEGHRCQGEGIWLKEEKMCVYSGAKKKKAVGGLARIFWKALRVSSPKSEETYFLSYPLWYLTMKVVWGFVWIN